MGKYKRRRRNMPYKVDSTKGDSMLSPVSYKKDVLVQVWMDSRWLATLSVWLDKQGNYTRFLSEVVNDSVRVLVGHLVDSGEVQLIDDTVEARNVLEMKYKVDLNRGGKGLKNKLHNVLLSDRRKSLKGKVEIETAHDTVDVPLRRGAARNSGFDIDKAMEIYKGIEEKEIEDARVESKRKLKEMIDSGAVSGLIPEEERKRLKVIKKKDEEHAKELKEAGPREGMVIKE